MSTSKFSLAQRAESFTHAFAGLQSLFREEHNARVHLTLSLIAIGFGAYLQLSLLEWVAISICIAGVCAVEILNSAIENLCDHITTERHPKIKLIKDYGAAAVLLASCGALIVGGIVFLPKLITALSGN